MIENLGNQKDFMGPVAQQLSAHFHFGSLGFNGSDPGCGHGTTCQAMLWQASHIKWRKMGMGVSSGPVFLS